MNNINEKLLAAKPDNPLLTSLHEIAQPAEINWLPQTLGWQLLVLLFFTYLLYRVYLVIKKYLSNAYRRAALSHLAELQLTLDESSELKKIPLILRKTALYGYPRLQVAPHLDNSWELWLDKECQGSDFSGQHRGVLSQLAYAKQPKLSTQQIQAIKEQAMFWVKNHRGAHD